MKINSVLIVLAVLLSASCSNLSKVLKNPDVDTRYNAAMQYYEEEDYAKAGIVLENLIPDIIGKPEAEKVQYYFAYCHYHSGQFDLANYYFKSFHDTYQRSAFAKEALFMSAYSLVASTPIYNLDQSNTEMTLSSLQDFINRYPESQYVAQAEAAIKELRAKLEIKAFEIAKQYQKLRRYEAAVIAFDNFRKNFPDSYLKEEAIFRRLESQYEYAKLSYYTVKAERIEELAQMYIKFIDKYPNSEFRKKAETFYKYTQKETAGL